MESIAHRLSAELAANATVAAFIDGQSKTRKRGQLKGHCGGGDDGCRAGGDNWSMIYWLSFIERYCLSRLITTVRSLSAQTNFIV